jgi:hypothetical protein
MSHPLESLDRRAFFRGTAGVVAGAGLAQAVGSASAAARHRPHDHRRRAPLPPPKPIPGGIQIPDGPLLHVFVPGPPEVTLPFSGLQLQGLDVEPSTITDFAGFTALAYLIGSAAGSDGRQYNLEADIRAYKGRYIAEDGSRHFGTFGFI